MLERIDKQNNTSKEKVSRGNESLQTRRQKEISRLSPYLSYKRCSPKKQKQLKEFIQNKIMRIERGHKTLKKMKIEKNRLEVQKA